MKLDCALLHKPPLCQQRSESEVFLFRCLFRISMWRAENCRTLLIGETCPSSFGKTKYVIWAKHREGNHMSRITKRALVAKFIKLESMADVLCSSQLPICGQSFCINHKNPYFHQSRLLTQTNTIALVMSKLNLAFELSFWAIKNRVGTRNNVKRKVSCFSCSTVRL